MIEAMATFNSIPSNDTIKLFQNLNTVLYFCGLTDFWIVNVQIGEKFAKVYRYVSVFIEIAMISFMASEVAAFFTQGNLSPKQEADRLVFGVSHPILYIYVMNLIYYKRNVKEVLYQLAAALKQVHNDEEVERQMISKLKLYLTAYVMSCGLCIMLYGISALIQYIRTGAPFITVIPAWPDVEDRSTVAQIVRVIVYFTWGIYFSRVSGSYILILSMFICLSFQYRNLPTYFVKLDSIFDNSRQLCELNKEFESALKVGIKLHVDTLWCTQECQKIYSIIFSAQLIMTIVELVSVMSQMMTSERTLLNIAAVVSTTSGIMITTGFLMWNAGDVTVEASYLPEAMYACGWQNCTGKTSACSRILLTLAMTQAQKPVVFKALGCVDISYQTYLSIFKSSYSVFSVIF